jgi:hypothetical protein
MVGSRDTERTELRGRAERPPRSFWFDPRLAIGVALVLASVAGVFGVVAASDRSVLVYSAATAFAPGDRIRPGDLELEPLRLGDAADRYLGQGDVPEEGVLVTRAVSAGELVPVSAVGSAASVRVASVVVTVTAQLPQSIGPSAVVDLWAAAETESHDFGPPVVLVGSATVVRVLPASGLIVENGGGSVEVLVPREKIARVLEAVANGDAVSLVPVSIPVRR